MTAVTQRVHALERANQVRMDRTKIKRDLGAGILEIDIVLTEKPAAVCRVPVYEILQWMPHVGPVRARKMIHDHAEAIVSESLPLGSLGPRSRERLTAQIVRQLGTGVPR